MKKDLIIFDFFGVISSEVFPIWGKRYFSEDEMKNVRKNIMTKADKGIIKEKEMFDKLSEITGEDSEKILRDWLETAVINDDVVSLIIKLRKKYKIVLLSNASGEFLKRIFERINTDELFDYMVISSEENLAKPDKEIFELVLSRVNIKASNSIFIDDNILNIEGAKTVGIDGILFKNIEQLKKELFFYNIIIDDTEVLTSKV